jgi:hypothetical protein
MKRLLFILVMTFCSAAFSTELICSGTQNWVIINAIGYKGKTSGERNITVTISLKNTDSKVYVRKVFSEYLPSLSLCFMENTGDSYKNRCKCSITEDEIACSYVEKEGNLDDTVSTITINRKTALSEVFQQTNYPKNDTGVSYAVRDFAKLECKVFEQNQF